MITFETKVWEKDWQKVLRPESIGVNLERCSHPFQERLITINNVEDHDVVRSKCQELYDEGVIDGYCSVDHFAQRALDHFGLREEDFEKGYRFSIAELVSIYLCKTPYLLHFSGDSMISENAPKDWLEIGIKVLESRPEVAVFNLTWNNNFQEAEREAIEQDDVCFYGYGFSDQMYLIRTADFINRIYHHNHPDSCAHHHGEIFEKRVDSWMRTEKRLRATLKTGSYIHPTYGD